MTDAVLTTLLRELRERFPPDADPQLLRIYLAARGCDAARIEVVLAERARERQAEASAAAPAPGRARRARRGTAAGGADAPVAAGELEVAPGAAPLRVLAPHERSRFVPEAWGLFLARQQAAGWSVLDFERIIERALSQIHGRITVEELRALLDGLAPGEPVTRESPTVH